MTYTPIAKDSADWDVPVNAAFVDQDGRITTNTANIATNSANITSNTSRLTAVEATANGDIMNLQFAEAGYKLINFPPEHMDPTGQAPTTGVIYLNKVVVHQTTSIANLNIWVANQGTALTAGQNFMGIYDSTGARVAVTADQSTVWNSSGWKSSALVGGPFNLSAGSYWIAVLANGVTGLTFGKSRSNNLSGALLNGSLAASAERWGTNGTGTSLPSSITPSSNALSQLSFWVGAA
jgi:hypothetical protein